MSGPNAFSIRRAISGVSAELPWRRSERVATHFQNLRRLRHAKAERLDDLRSNEVARMRRVLHGQLPAPNSSRVICWCESSRSLICSNLDGALARTRKHIVDDNSPLPPEHVTVKHANPLAGPYGFPLRLSGSNMRIETNPDPDDLLQVWSVIVLLFSSHKLLEAGVAVKRCHSEFVRFDASVEGGLVSLLAECRSLMARNIATSGSSLSGAVH